MKMGDPVKIDTSDQINNSSIWNYHKFAHCIISYFDVVDWQFAPIDVNTNITTPLHCILYSVIRIGK